MMDLTTGGVDPRLARLRLLNQIQPTLPNQGLQGGAPGLVAMVPDRGINMVPPGSLPAPTLPNVGMQSPPMNPRATFMPSRRRRQPVPPRGSTSVRTFQDR